MTSNKIVALATGGTGGHIFPAQATAEILEERGYKVVWLVDQRYVKAGYGKIDDINKFLVASSPLKKGILGKIETLLNIIKGTISAIFILKKVKPIMTIGFGGYVSFPICLAAYILKYKYCLQEQNAVIGKANKFLLAKAEFIAVSYVNTLDIFPKYKKKTFYTGIPVRKKILRYANSPYNKNYNFLNILVIGGSLGAKIFADIIPNSLISLPDELKRNIKIVQQVREEDYKEVKEKYSNSSINFELNKFFSNIEQKIIEADLIIARAGASTIAELMVIARPAIYVPLPNAMRNHQLRNAEFLAQDGLGILIEQRDFTVDNLTKLLKKFMAKNNKELHNIATNIQKIKFSHDSSIKLVDLVESYCKK